eukprot:scaffold104524_cov85-Cyclotella_meneghiniana.AAC.1
MNSRTSHQGHSAAIPHGVLDDIPVALRYQYARDFAAADASFYAGRVAATTKDRETHWKNWAGYCQPLGVDPYLQGIPHWKRARVLTGFAARVRHGGYGSGRKVKGGTVSTQITSIGKEIHMVCGNNPTKIDGSDRFIPRLSQTLDGWKRHDDPVEKKLPVEVDVAEYL